MARPRKPAAEKRDAQIPPIRVTTSELIHVQDQAELAGVSVTDFARQLVLRGEVAPKQTTTDHRMIVELNRIGVNLNQIARTLNRGGDNDPHHLDYILQELHTALQKVVY